MGTGNNGKKTKYRIYELWRVKSALRDISCGVFLRRTQPQLCRQLELFRTATGATGCSWFTYLSLFLQIRLQKPARVWEGGSGATTIVMAEALRLNNEEGSAGKLVSCEQHEGYHAAFAASFPKHLADFVDLRLSNVASKLTEHGTGHFYSDGGNDQFDLVFVDGPTTPKIKNHYNSDLPRLINEGRGPKVAFVDGRPATVAVLRAVAPRALVLMKGSLTKITFSDASRLHSSL